MIKKIGLGVGVLFLLLLALALVAYIWLKAQLVVVESTDSFDERYFQQLPVQADFAASQREACADRNPQRNAYFGELHVHTAVSHDSGSFGNVVTPADAYAFAKGEAITLKLSGDDPQSPQAMAALSKQERNAIPVVKLKRPLDFAAVTDHAENFGEATLCTTPGSPAYPKAICKLYRGDLRLPVSDVMQPLMRMLGLVIFQNNRSAKICGEDGSRCIDEAANIWRQQQLAAEQAYDRSSTCRFSSFVAYEYSLAKEQANLHRNVIFANATVPPIPLSSKDQTNPADLWQWLKSYCVDTDTGCNALAIPHNSNWSSGRMFYPYTLADDLSENEKRSIAQLRNELEPLVEIMQVKGDSECRNGLSGVVGAYDELCDFEKLRDPKELAEDCGDEVGSGGMSLTGCLSRNSYVRSALIQGLKEQDRLGVNPFAMGVIAATDTHTGTSGAVSESEFKGSTGMDRSAERRLGGPRIVPGVAKGDTTRYNPGGLAGIWAEENSRPALFSAMQRKETFGTSGPRILPRLFAAWDFEQSLCESPDMIEQAYANGVTMGGELLSVVDKALSPTLLVSALKDSLDGAANLQKIQIIKGWVGSDGQLNEQVIDVAGDTDLSKVNRQKLNTQTCEPLKSGYQSLCTVWRDPDFDPAISAVYYARVVENPSCRWSTYDCNAFADIDRPAACSNADMPSAIQERAWTSPIWYRASP